MYMFFSWKDINPINDARFLSALDFDIDRTHDDGFTWTCKVHVDRTSHSFVVGSDSPVKSISLLRK